VANYARRPSLLQKHGEQSETETWKVAFGAQNDLSLEQSLRRRPADVLMVTTFEKSDESQVRLRRQWQSRKIKSSR
jgi:hypothetical protein